MAIVKKKGTRIICGKCHKHIFDFEIGAANRTFKAYAKGKYGYCAKCGEKVEMNELLILAKEVGMI